MVNAEGQGLIAGRYELGVCIGQGGMGRVFRGTDLVTGSAVAIKQLRQDRAGSSAQSLERFQREGEALAKLNHPNIVRMLGMLNEAGQDYLILEFMAGGSLEEALSSSSEPMAIGRILSIGLDLSDALVRTHRLDIIHRDIKASNVLLADDGSPRLTDFGAAHIEGRERLTEASAIIGTSDYLSPEALRGEELDARTDIWAFGVLLFELLTRRRPFSRRNIAETFHSIAFSPPPDLPGLRPDCPAPLVDLVYRMLAKDRNQRIPSARRVAAELESILHGGSRQSEPSILAELTARGGRIVRNNLPATTATFVGRDTELDKLERCLSKPEVRLVTIVAPGGMGKTRLTLELGSRLVASLTTASRDAWTSRFSSGVFLVQLSALSSPEFIVSAVAEALGLQFYPGREPKPQLFDHLAEKKLLLLMDNFEHLLEGASFVTELLGAARGLTVIATSRERLNLVGETLFPLSGMNYPEAVRAPDAAEFDAVRLFMQCARQVKPDFSMQGEEAQHVAHVCRLVQGAPLGILLAASWSATLSAREMAEEIRRGLDFLAAELRDLPPRQRSMRAVFDHSWRLLEEQERVVLARLSVFRGGFTREAAEAITDASIRELAALINKSLLRRDPATGRYRTHALLRQYAEQKLRTAPAQFETVLDAHGAYFAGYLHAQEASLKSGHPGDALSGIEADLDNVRAAWLYVVSERKLGAVELSLESLQLFHTRRASFGEAEAAFAALAESLRAACPDASGEHSRVLAQALSLRASFLRQQGRYAPAQALLLEALSILDETRHRRERAFALVAYGSTVAKIGDAEQGKGLAEQGLELYRSTDDAWGLASSLETLGRLYATTGDFHKAEEAYREATALQRSSGLLPSALMGLGIASTQQGNYDEGCRMMFEALELFESAGDVWNKMRCQMNLANAKRNLGHYVEAETLARACLDFAKEVGNWDHEAWSYFQLGNILKEQGLYDAAETQFTAAHELSVAAGDAGKVALAKLEFGDLASIRGDYTEAKQHLAESLGGFESSGQTWGIVLALDHLAEVACHEGAFELSRSTFERAFETAIARKLYPFATNIAAGLALLHARLGSPERALELLALSQHHPATEHHTVTRRISPLLTELRQLLPRSTFEAAFSRGKSLRLESVSQGVTCSR